MNQIVLKLRFVTSPSALLDSLNVTCPYQSVDLSLVISCGWIETGCTS